MCKYVCDVHVNGCVCVCECACEWLCVWLHVHVCVGVHVYGCVCVCGCVCMCVWCKQISVWVSELMHMLWNVRTT